jgi:hypothetical protein
MPFIAFFSFLPGIRIVFVLTCGMVWVLLSRALPRSDFVGTLDYNGCACRPTHSCTFWNLV